MRTDKPGTHLVINTNVLNPNAHVFFPRAQNVVVMSSRIESWYSLTPTMPIKPSFVPIKLNTNIQPFIPRINSPTGTIIKCENSDTSHDCEDTISCQLNKIRSTNIHNVVIGLLNINSVIRKFDALKSIISGMIDVMIIVESKLDDSFPTSQFLIDGHGIPFRRDRNKFGGGILIYVREDIPCKLLDRHQLPDDIEGLFVELNFRKSRLLLLGTYHPPNQKENYFFQSISQAIDIYSTDYGKYIFTGDFNTEENEVAIKKFLVVHGLKNLVNVTTCFKSLEKPRCIDLFLTNNYRSFLNTRALSSGLSDFHKLVVTVMKTTFPKANPKKIFYRKYNFDVITYTT